MKKLKKIMLFSFIPLLIVSVFFLNATIFEMRPNLEVFEVGEYVRYKSIRHLYIKNYNGNPNAIGEVILNFVNSDYEAESNSSNDYYIIKGFEKINPLELKVGDRLYFDYRIMLESNPGIARGSYLYFCD